MRHKVLPIVIASVIAAVVLIATLLAPTPDAGPSGDSPDVVDPLDVNTSLRLGDDDPAAGIPIEQVDRGSFTRVEEGKVVRVTWERATPLTEGVSEVTKPRARMFFEGGRALQITADEGRFVAPDRQPQSGLFRGNVVVTLVEGEPDQVIDFDDDAAVEMRVFIDGEARFDLVLNQIETADRVHLTGPRVEFFGTGLELSYNQRRNRLGRLDVTFGRLLRLKPEPTPDDAPSASATDTASATDSATAADSATVAVSDTAPTPTADEALAKAEDARETTADTDAAPAVPDALAGASAGPDVAQEAKEPAEPEEKATFYRARFENNVWITAPAEDAVITGDAFELVFAMTGGALVGDGVASARPSPANPEISRINAGRATVGKTGAGHTPAGVATSHGGFASPISAGVSRAWAYPDPASGSAQTYAEMMRSERDAERSLFVPGEDDLIVRWTGRMRVLPIATREQDAEADASASSLRSGVEQADARDAEDLADLAGPDDVLMRVTGEPAVIESGDGRRIAAGEIDYLGSTGRVRAWQRASTPVRLRSDDLGTLSGTGLTWRPGQRRAEVTGPGVLKREEVVPAESSNEANGEASDEATDPPLLVTREGLEAAWEDRLVIRFARGKSDRPTAEPSEPFDSGIGRLQNTQMPESLESADFRGDVRITHPRLRLDAEHVRLDFTSPVNASQSPEPTQSLAGHSLPRRLVAEGTADLRLLADTPEESARIRGGEIAIDLDSDDGSTDTLRPTRLLATRKASIERDGSLLAADRIDARFNRAHEADGETGEVGTVPNPPDVAPQADFAGGELALRDLLAEGGVQLRDPERDLVLTGHRLEVDPASETSQLFGRDETPAVARRDDGFITGQRLVLDQRTDTIRVPGGGSFEALLDPEARDQTLNIDWSRSMSFQHQIGLAEFHGKVRALAIGRTEVTELTSDSLSAQLDIGPASPANHDEAAADPLPADATPVRPADAPPDATADAPADDRPAIAKVKRVTARGNAVLKARVFATDPRGRPRTRLRMQGPIINFENLPEEKREQVQVIGDGSMQFEDYRPVDEKEPPSQGEDETRLAGVTGRGATLLLWKDRLTLDAAANDLIAEGGVTLLHRSPDAGADMPADADDAKDVDDEEMLQLDARRLVVNLAETGGLGVWLGEAPPAPDLESIDADRSVRVVRGDKTILADHLRYTRESDAIRFTADPGGFVRIQREGEARTPRARTVIYHLAEDRLQAFDIVGGAAAGP